MVTPSGRSRRRSRPGWAGGCWRRYRPDGRDGFGGDLPPHRFADLGGRDDGQRHGRAEEPLLEVEPGGLEAVWNIPTTVDRMSRTTDSAVELRNARSEKVSREKADLRSSLTSMEKNRLNSARVTMPMVRATGRP